MAARRKFDSKVKSQLRKWSFRTKVWGVPDGSGYWIRALPKEDTASATCPRIETPGSALFKTQPDGMWVYLHNIDYADVIAIEACGSRQNIEQKRGKYASVGQSRVLRCPRRWLHEEVALQRGGTQARWLATCSLDDEPKDDLLLPIRYCRVLYALPTALYRNWRSHVAPEGHEYFCKYSSLDSFNSPRMREFFRRLQEASHFYTRS